MKSVLIRVYPWLLIATHAVAADPISEALQKGLFEEEANHNLAAAIKAYQSVIDQTAEQRKLTATAVFRLGECYRKLNKTNEAVGQYQRLLREFSDQSSLVSLSQQNLSALGSDATRAASLDTTAAERAEIEKIKVMIKDSPDLINGRGPDGRTPLHNAAYNGYRTVARFLIANHADVNARDDTGGMPLHWAVYAGHRTMVELLLQHGADVNAFGKIRPEVGSERGGQPLTLAVSRGYRAVVETLIAHKADVSGKGSPSNEIPLYTAVSRGFTAIVKLLLDHGADVNGVGGRGGDTVLLVAATAGQNRTLDAAELLLERGANVNAQNNKGYAALHRAVQSPEMTKLLLKHKPNLELQAEEGRTPLYIAVLNGDIECMELLLQAGANPNVEARVTPLISAIQMIEKEKVEVLLKYKADPNQVSGHFPPLFYALHPSGRTFSSVEKQKFAEIAELLRQHGAKEEVNQ